MDALLESTEPHAAPLTATYVSTGALDVRQTVGQLLRGASEPTMRFTPNGFWRVMRTPDGPATLRVEWRPARVDDVTSPADGCNDETSDATPTGGARPLGWPSARQLAEAHRPTRVDARAWGPGAAWALRGLPALLGHGDRAAWNDLDLSRVPLLAEVRRTHPGMRLGRTSLVFESLVPSILEQKVTTVAARRSWHWLLRAYGEVPPGPAPEGMRVQPSARQWQLIPSWEWHWAGVGPDRSRTIVAAAAVASSLDRLPCTVDGVLEKLQSLRGVGPWTAAETSQRSHGHPDAVSVGDYHLAAHVGWVLLGKPVDDEGMLELLEPWRGHRQRIVRLILASGVGKPRFGPRATITDHRWH